MTDPTRVYHPLAPGPETRRALVVYAFGSALGLALMVYLSWRAHETALRGTLMGGGLAILWSLGRSLLEYAHQQRFARRGELELEADALRFVDEHGRESRIPWKELEGQTNGGRLQLTWAGGELLIGAREWEDGMQLTRIIAARLAPSKPTNFIPLTAVEPQRRRDAEESGDGE